MNSPSELRALTAPIAAPLVWVGRIIEQIGKLPLRNGHGSGMIRLASNVSSVLAVRSTNLTVELFIGSETVSGGKPAFAFPALSCQV